MLCITYGICKNIAYQKINICDRLECINTIKHLKNYAKYNTLEDALVNKD